ncbi:hypothetical protein XbC2_450 [Xanthomonas phage XbC2]|nr:hypothetical protein XbC2_450 [Xanthomonas phage XbC2]
MKYFYEILIAIVILIALLTIVTKSAIIAVVGIGVFITGCFIEYLINRTKT